MKIAQIIVSVIILFAAGRIPVIYAQSENDVFKDLDTLRNPFIPYIAKKKKEPPVVVKPPVPVKPVAVVKPPVKVVTPPPPPPPKPRVEAVVDTSFLKEIKISGLVWNTDTPQAIINGKVVKVGDEIKGSKITSIRKDGVELTFKGLKYFLSIIENKSGSLGAKP